MYPIPAGVVQDLDQLSTYPYGGHSVVMGNVKHGWQNVQDVLGMFGGSQAHARRSYRNFVEKGIAQGKRHDLTGGGLLRSAGGWEGVKALREEKVYQRNDERILGDGDFVVRVLASAEEDMERRYALRARGIDLDSVAARVSELLNINAEAIWAKGKYQRIVDARSLLCYWAVRELGLSATVLAERLRMTQAAVSISVKRGKKIAEEMTLKLDSMACPSPAKEHSRE
jgi:hypothetical protein